MSKSIFKQIAKRISNMSNDDVHRVAKIGFSKEVENYDKARPTYPNECFEKISQVFNLDSNNETSEKINVLDLAAGTGIFTKLLDRNKNLKIFAVEPNLEMRKGFTKNLPHIPIYDGSSTAIPFEDGFFQVVFIAQAFHWFANIESLREVHRVLKPQSSLKPGYKSGLVLIWNLEDRYAEPYIGELRDLYEKYDSDVPQYRKNEWMNVFKYGSGYESLFEPLHESIFFQNDVQMRKSLIWSRILSKSYIAMQPEEIKSKLKEQVDLVLQKYEDRFIRTPEDVEEHVRFPTKTELTWCFKKAFDKNH